MGEMLGLLTLVGYGLHELLDLLGVAEEVVLDEVEVVIELKDVGHCRGEVQLDDIFVRDPLEDLDDTT